MVFPVRISGAGSSECSLDDKMRGPTIRSNGAPTPGIPNNPTQRKMLSAEDSIPTCLGKARILRLLGKGKSGYSYLAELGGSEVVFKQMHHEPCPYYHFGDNKVKLEVAAYHRLRDAGVELPQLLAFDEERDFLIKEYCRGPVADHWDPDPDEIDRVIGQLFCLAGRLRLNGLNIDYFPANFVIVDTVPQYIDYEVNPYDPRWSFEQWGIYYWANRVGMRRYAESHDWRHINVNEQSGEPITSPFEAQVSAWRQKFAQVSDA